MYGSLFVFIRLIVIVLSWSSSWFWAEALPLPHSLMDTAFSGLLPSVWTRQWTLGTTSS
jgi:hypothetical protein